MSTSVAVTASTSSQAPAPASSTAVATSSLTSSSNSLLPSLSSTSTSKTSYHIEITQMIYVFTLIKSPDPGIVQFIQDVVRQQLIQLIIAAKLHASTHSVTTTTTGKSTTKQPQQPHSTSSTMIQIEDLLFVIRDDVSKVERLKLYLSWKDVRKKTRAEGMNSTGGAGGEEDEIDGIEEPDKKDLKVGKSRINLRWELEDPWIEYLSASASTTTSSSSVSTPPPLANGEEERLGEEKGSSSMSVGEKKAYEVNREILREANELTEKMTREEYEHYSVARTATFVYRKSKKFRDFLLLDAATSLSDELLDILGFLAYELVRTLCKAGIVEARSRATFEGLSEAGDGEKKRKREEEEEEKVRKLDPNDKDYPSVLRPVPASMKKKKGNKLEEIVSLFSAPLESSPQPQTTTTEADETVTSSTTKSSNPIEAAQTETRKKPTLDLPPKLELKDLLNGFWNETHRTELNTPTRAGGSGSGGSKVGMGKGLRSFRGGIGAVKGGEERLF
ncbi:transcriptional regulator SPT3 [Sporobolomyces salmoneus]|uniref:transcriptional regulator SPT3 n=1 Tax=Sporobolomyces salmoneus TaxID=183962 RepID=UPI003171078A